MFLTPSGQIYSADSQSSTFNLQLLLFLYVDALVDNLIKVKI